MTVVLRTSASIFTVVLLAAQCGCGSKPASADGLSGKVTLSGSPVSGQVIFVTGDGKQLPAPIGPDGTYSITGLPQGEAQILVKGDPKVNAMLPKGIEAPSKNTSAGPPPPEKYSKPGNGLKVSVSGSKQNYDIELTP